MKTIKYKLVVDGFRTLSSHYDKKSAKRALAKFLNDHPNAVAWVKRY